jgi:hypothetical protein
MPRRRLFNKSPLQLRLIGTRGGRALGRNQRIRRALLPAPCQLDRILIVFARSSGIAFIWFWPTLKLASEGRTNWEANADQNCH